MRALEMCWVFGDGMVVQAERPLPVWGQALPGEEVTVRFAGQVKSAKANGDGEWSVKLDPLVVSGEGREFRVEAGSGTKVFADVLVGDVWLCSGQSNMAQPEMENSTGGEEESKKPENRLLRSFNVAYNAWAAEPDRRNFAWEKKISNWFEWKPVWRRTSAVPYYFGAMVQRETGRPVGLIVSPVGASNAEAWVPMKALEAETGFAQQVSNSRRWIAGAPGARKEFEAEVAAWEERKKVAEGRGETFKERKPNDFRPELVARFWVGALYNARIAPLRTIIAVVGGRN